MVVFCRECIEYCPGIIIVVVVDDVEVFLWGREPMHHINPIYSSFGKFSLSYCHTYSFHYMGP
jgi:hypothetical protein